MIIVENPNEQVSIDSKVLEAEDSALPATVPTNVPPPPYLPPPSSNTGLLPVAPQNHEPILSHPGPPNRRQESASSRFLKAFGSALLVIALMRMFIWSVDLVAFHGREPREWTSHTRLPHGSGCGIMHPRCPPQVRPPPRRIVPTRYPPHASPDSRS